MTPLRSRWLDHLKDNPQTRTLDAAQALGVTEAELLYSRVGDDAMLLQSDWKELLEALPAVGEVMCLTRNRHVVHERTGAYERVEASPFMAGVYGSAIEQRLIVGRWGAAIAAPVETRKGTMKSLQIFDRSGRAALKIYAVDGTDDEAWDALVDRLQERLPPPSLTLTEATPDDEQADDAIDREGLRAAWATMKDTHDVYPLLRRLQVGRLQALRLLGPEWTQPIERAGLTALLQGAADDAEPIMVFVGNSGSIQIFSGEVHRIVARDGWLNVLDPGFNLHVRESGLASTWIVRKPTDRGLVWSLESYGEDGETLLQVFGTRTEAQSQRSSWHDRLTALQNDFLLPSDLSP